MRPDPFRAWKIGGAILGAVVLGGFGVVFGRYGFPGLEISQRWTDLQDPDATAGMFGWIFAMIGLPIGARYGEQAGERQDGRRRRREWLASHPEQAAESEEQTRLLRADSRRRSRRSSRRKRSPWG